MKRFSLVLFVLFISVMTCFSENYTLTKRINTNEIGFGAEFVDFHILGDYLYVSTIGGIVKISRVGKLIENEDGVYIGGISADVEGDIVASVSYNPLEGKIIFLTEKGDLYYAGENYSESPIFNVKKYTSDVGTISVDENGLIYISSPIKGEVLVFSSEFKYLRSISSKGSDEKHLQTPLGIEVRKGKIYIADSSSHLVKVFSTDDGSFIRSVGEFTNGNKGLISPVDVGVDRDGNIYVLDKYKGIIKKFSKSGEYITEIKPDISGDPRRIFVEDNGDLWVLSFYEILKYEKE